MSEEIPPLIRSPELRNMVDLSEKLQAAEILADHGRDPRLADFAIRSKGDDVPAKVRAFEKLFDTTVAEEVEKRFARGQPSQKISGSVSGKEFLSLAAQAQDESIPAIERDSLISEMMTALKQGRVR
jgi:hypothetical protein